MAFQCDQTPNDMLRLLRWILRFTICTIRFLIWTTRLLRWVIARSLSKMPEAGPPDDPSSLGPINRFLLLFLVPAIAVLQILRAGRPPPADAVWDFLITLLLMRVCLSMWQAEVRQPATVTLLTNKMLNATLIMGGGKMRIAFPPDGALMFEAHVWDI